MDRELSSDEQEQGHSWQGRKVADDRFSIKT